MYILDGLYALGVRGPLIDGPMLFFTLLAERGVLLILTAIILTAFKKTRKTGFMLAAALLIGFIVSNLVLKPLIARPRPYTLRPEVLQPFGELEDFSFPSAHTCAAFETAVVFFHRDKTLGAVMFAAAFAVAFSRLYFFLHYPTDVIAGALVGLVSGAAACALVEYIYRRASQKDM